jgi:hypothetical protein
MIPKSQVHRMDNNPNPTTETIDAETETLSARGLDSARIALDGDGLADVLREQSSLPEEEVLLDEGAWGDASSSSISTMLPPRSVSKTAVSPTASGVISKTASFSLWNSTLTDDSDEES